MGNCTDEETGFNYQISSVRLSVEHNYKELEQTWRIQDFARNLLVLKLL